MVQHCRYSLVHLGLTGRGGLTRRDLSGGRYQAVRAGRSVGPCAPGVLEWGFEGASYSELTEATGLNKSSLYNAFGDKKALYVKCLNRFSDAYGAPLLSRLEHHDFVEAIAGYFEGLIRRMEADKTPRGCPLSMAALELGGSNGEIGRVILGNMEITEVALRARCDRAVRDGELPPDTDTEAVASLFLTVIHGLPALNRGLGDLRCCALSVKALLQMLKAAPQRSYNAAR